MHVWWQLQTGSFLGKFGPWNSFEAIGSLYDYRRSCLQIEAGYNVSICIAGNLSGTESSILQDSSLVVSQAARLAQLFVIRHSRNRLISLWCGQWFFNWSRVSRFLIRLVNGSFVRVLRITWALVFLMLLQTLIAWSCIELSWLNRCFLLRLLMARWIKDNDVGWLWLLWLLLLACWDLLVGVPWSFSWGLISYHLNSCLSKCLSSSTSMIEITLIVHRRRHNQIEIVSFKYCLTFRCALPLYTCARCEHAISLPTWWWIARGSSTAFRYQGNPLFRQTSLLGSSGGIACQV